MELWHDLALLVARLQFKKLSDGSGAASAHLKPWHAPWVKDWGDKLKSPRTRPTPLCGMDFDEWVDKPLADVHRLRWPTSS